MLSITRTWAHCCGRTVERMAAVEMLPQACAKAPRSYLFFMNLGFYHEEMGDQEPAAQAYRACVRVVRKRTRASVLLA